MSSEGSPKLSGLDGFFANNFIIAIILAVCCSGIGMILGIVGLIVCKDPKAKQNAMITAIVGGILFALGIGLNFSGVLNR